MLEQLRLFVHRWLILSWALAIFYLHLGSLVNFHQHFIWKKYLIPTVIAGKKEKKEESEFKVTVKHLSGNSGNGFMETINHDVDVNHSLLTGGSELCFIPCENLWILDIDPANHALRAPPRV